MTVKAMAIWHYKKIYKRRCLVCEKMTEGLFNKKFCSTKCKTRSRYHRLKAKKMGKIDPKLTENEIKALQIIGYQVEHLITYPMLASKMKMSVNKTITFIAILKAKGYLHNKY